MTSSFPCSSVQITGAAAKLERSSRCCASISFSVNPHQRKEFEKSEELLPGRGLCQSTCGTYHCLAWLYACPTEHVPIRISVSDTQTSPSQRHRPICTSVLAIESGACRVIRKRCPSLPSTGFRSSYNSDKTDVIFAEPGAPAVGAGIARSKIRGPIIAVFTGCLDKEGSTASLGSIKGKSIRMIPAIKSIDANTAYRNRATSGVSEK